MEMVSSYIVVNVGPATPMTYDRRCQEVKSLVTSPSDCAAG